MQNTWEILVNSSAYSYTSTYESYFFNEPRHLIQQGNPHVDTFVWANHARKTFEARISFFVENQKAISPYRATFGSLEFHPNLSVDALVGLFRFIHSFFQTKNIQQIFIKSYPFAYQLENAQILTQILLQLGYQIVNSELNYHLDVSQDDFQTKLHTSEKRRLQKCISAGFAFEEWLQPDLHFVYEFIKTNRFRKGYPITLTWMDFEKLIHTFPHDFKIFVVKDPPQIIALVVAIVINPHILYSFYPADLETYLKHSPSVMLHAGLYQYAQQQGFKILDLGISTDQGRWNEGLIRFKKNLGAITSLKLSFEKWISR
jgi:hypothetical protein